MDTDDPAINQRLLELDTLDTFSEFSRAFCRLIAHVVALAGSTRPLRLGLMGLLDIELRYHRSLQGLAQREEVSFADLQAASERRQVGLRAVRQYALGLELDDGLQDAARELLLAECGYHLRRTAEVVGSLERVLELGVGQPLVHLALGYNRYLLALETCTEPAGDESELTVRDPGSFRVQCLQAVSALEEGLEGAELDGQLYWWMATILQGCGLTEAAQDAYDKSAKLLHLQQQDDLDVEDDEAWDAPTSASDSISDDEIREASLLLQEPLNPTWLMRDEQDEG